ncbi:glycosyltransferase [Limnohabitans sp. Rim8]|uniref:glycosyltransferase n=1 Tax=Limnohabitans sp. Rim8 TaxID=1100718 RepID=UPI0025D2137F|nr:glycosyltransferase [Limnohabitans sp. Rim8]
MTNTDEINTQRYWDGRFNEDWEQFDGPAQSRFFSTIALQNIPDWLLNEAKGNKLTIADWGCAQGDGTSVWADYVASIQITGIDFSEAAIQIAKKRYPDIKFLAENWLEPSFNSNLKYDIVFSSNTLEHFHKPFDILNNISNHAEKILILALPYKEHQRIDEHFFTFIPENIPSVIKRKFHLAWSRVINCKDIPASYWPGEQIILIYIDSEWMESLNLKLSDISLERDDSIFLRENHGVLLAERDQAINERNLAINERARADVVREHLQMQLQTMLTSNSWAITRPLRFLGRIARYGLTKNDTHRLAIIVKPYWHMLPISHELRQSIGKRMRRFLARVATVASVNLKKPESLPELATNEVGKPDYFVFSVIDWHFRHQRPQQLALQIAETGRRVFYISVDFVDHAEPGFALESLDSSGRLFNLHLHLQGAPSVYGKPPTAAQMSQLTLSMGSLLEWTQSTSVVSLIQHSFWSGLAAQMPNSRLVYDCMDHHEGFGGVSDEMIAHERALLAAADLTVTTSLWLDNEVGSKTSRHVLIRNATEFEHFAKAPTGDIYKDPQGRRIIGYYGAIAEWFDVDLVGKVAQAFPDCAIVLIGADTVGAQRKLSAFTNVKFLGEIPYKQLPSYAHAFNVCLLPFKVIPLTLATNPVKAYEYLSMGKPVVSTDLPEVREMGSVCTVATDASDFVAQIKKSLDNSGTPETRQTFAQEQTWAHRAQALIAASEDASYDPLVSIVVVTYNNLDLTKKCLASLDAYSDYANMEIIVVDNASSDGSQAWLTEWAKEALNRKLVLNEDNRGFAAGNNQGLTLAGGKYLVMLNNDTHVTPGWVRTMVNHMRCDASIGLLGPVTNNIGNEARIEIFYDDMAQMLQRSASYTHAHVGQLLPLRTAAFFCVMLRREVFEKIGPLDEAFGRGFFEDDDYCRRIEQAGLSVYCAEDVFIHHHLSASFNKLRSSERQALFEKNKATYEAKWGAWIPHEFRQ